MLNRVEFRFQASGYDPSKRHRVLLELRHGRRIRRTVAGAESH
jgi:hypothetical protein